uniref:L-serine deaminase n=1 Tax=Scleropages formosus TaxID=113540 RepID=A0A8C9UZP8_SCLFO
MNFAAQFFYSSYKSDGSPRRSGFGDSDEYDPFWQSEGERLGASEQSRSHTDGKYKDCPVPNGCLSRRPTPIHPERLKDFGEEEYLNGDVKTWETKVAGDPEPQLLSPPKPVKKKDSDAKTTTKTQNEYLRFEDISAAAFKIQSTMQKTPCTYSRLSKQYGMEIFLKKEHLHYTGSVKERGVLYLLTSLKQEQQKKGVIVATDSNFSMAVAHHASNLRIPAFVIMPASSSPSRLRMYRDFGAMVISYGSTYHDSQNHARHLAKENNYLYLEEDDSAVYIAGLGTVGMEIYEQVPKLDAVIVPAGGECGLLAGTAAALKHLNPSVSVIVSILAFDLVDPPLGSRTFQLAKRLVDKVVSVREEDVLVAMLKFQEYEKTTVDTGGAIGLAAILAGQLTELKGKRVAVLISSANMELGLVRQCVERALVLDDQVSRFSVQLGDWPGDMAKLLDILAREDYVISPVSFCLSRCVCVCACVQVECVVETRDRTLSAHLRNVLSERYPTLRWQER